MTFVFSALLEYALVNYASRSDAQRLARRKHQKQWELDHCAFDPENLLNPGKVFPVLHRCAELGRVHVHRGRTRFPHLPRF